MSRSSRNNLEEEQMIRRTPTIAVCCEAFGECVFYPSGVDVNDCYDCAARLPCHGCDEEPNCAGAYDERGGAGCWGCAVEGVDCDGEGFEKGRCVEGDVVWYSVEFNISLKSVPLGNGGRHYLWHQIAGWLIRSCKVPWKCGTLFALLLNLIFLQRLYRPFLQIVHWPQGIPTSRATRSPMLKPLTAGPMPTTTPDDS